MKSVFLAAIIAASGIAFEPETASGADAINTLK